MKCNDADCRVIAQVNAVTPDANERRAGLSGKWDQIDKESMMTTTESSTSIRRRGVRETMGKFFVVTFVLAVFGLFLSGCNNDRALESGASPGPADPRSYFPVQSGYSVTFSVTDSAGQEIRQEVFSSISATTFDGLPGMRWEGRNLSDSSVTASGTIFWDNSGVYHQADGASSAEALIVAPLEVGANWPRWRDFGDSSITGGGTDQDILDGGGGSGSDLNDDDDGSDVSLSTSYPTKGSSTFYVAALDDLVQSGSQSFSPCLQIINAGSGETVNRYWYHEGSGLVKYALGCQFGVLTGTENAEFVR